MNFGSKGQAFDVFKLLIAAIVALAILMILLAILAKIMPPPTDNPNKVAADLINANYRNSSAYVKGQEVLFSNRGYNSLNITAIAALSKEISSSLVCIHSGDFAVGANKNFEFREDILKYAGGDQERAVISVLCDAGAKIRDDFSKNDLDKLKGEVRCGDGSITALPNEGSETYCIVVLRSGLI